MTTKPRLEIRQAHLQYWGRLDLPSVSLVNDLRVADQLLAKLSPYGARLDGLWMTVSPQNLAGSSVTLTLLGGEATVQLTPWGIDISFGGSGDRPSIPLILPKEVLSEIVARVAATVEAPEEPRRLDSHTFTLSVHASLGGQDVPDLLGSYVRHAPGAFGETLRAGVRYVFQPVGESRGSWLVAEPSSLITPNGLYVSCSIELDGERVGAERAADAAREHLAAIIESPDLPVRMGND